MLELASVRMCLASISFATVLLDTKNRAICLSHSRLNIAGWQVPPYSRRRWRGMRTLCGSRFELAFVVLDYLLGLLAIELLEVSVLVFYPNLIEHIPEALALALGLVV